MDGVRKISSLGSSFANCLRSFQTGGVTYSDFLGHISRQLNSGASPAELSEVLRRRELIEPLPEYAHSAVSNLLETSADVVVADVVVADPADEAAAAEPTDAADGSMLAERTAARNTPFAPDLAASVYPSSTGSRLAGTPPPAVPDGAPSHKSPARPTAVQESVDRQNARRDERWQWRWRTIALVAVIVAVGVWLYGRTNGKVAGVAPHVISIASAPLLDPATTTAPRQCPACPPMTVVPRGRFKQGSARGDPEGLPSEAPQHVVLIRKPFAMSTRNVTVGEFDRFTAATGRTMPSCKPRPAAADAPVTCVSWNDANTYAAWLSVQSGETYRLPSASEWEYAARAGAEGARPAPASLKTNAFGLVDMLGGIAQWTADCWHGDYLKSPIDGSTRLDGDCTERELRGGAPADRPANDPRFSFRTHLGIDDRTARVGFRLAK